MGRHSKIEKAQDAAGIMYTQCNSQFLNEWAIVLLHQGTPLRKNGGIVATVSVELINLLQHLIDFLTSPIHKALVWQSHHTSAMLTTIYLPWFGLNKGTLYQNQSAAVRKLLIYYSV